MEPTQNVEINQIPDIGPIDVQTLTLDERLNRLEDAAGITNY